MGNCQIRTVHLKSGFVWQHKHFTNDNNSNNTILKGKKGLYKKILEILANVCVISESIRVRKYL